MPTAQVQAVTEHIAGSELSQDLTANLYPSPGLYPDTDLYPGGEREMVVVDLDEFDHDGGLFAIGTESGSYVIVGETAEDGSGVLNLVDSLASTYSAGEPVYEVNPDGSQRKERWADVIEPDGEETLRVRVPHTMMPFLPVGTRDPEVDVSEVVTFANDGTDLVITDVLGVQPKGVELSPSSSLTPSDDQAIRWFRGDDGELIGRVVAAELSTANSVVLDASTGTTSRIAGSTLRGRRLDNSLSAQIGATAGTTGATVSLTMFTSGGSSVTKTLLRDTGTSDWVLDESAGWQDWTPTLTGWSSNPTNAVYRYKQTGKMVVACIRQLTNGTSNAVSKTISAPVTAATITNMRWDESVAVVDNGVALAVPGRARIASGGTVINFDKDASAADGWTASGGHRIVTCTLIYEAA